MSLEIFIGGAILGGFIIAFYAMLFWIASQRGEERQKAYEKLGQILTDKDVQKILKEKGLI